MNNKEFVAALSARCDWSAKDTRKRIDSLVKTIAESLEDGDSLSIPNFGTFEIKKKKERIIMNPTTKQRQLVPPKLAISFKASNLLKDKLKQ